jgi:DNA-binding XRE family transcriptional regulator
MTAIELMQFRRKLGMSRAKLSDAIGASETAIKLWENGVNAIPKYIALACRAYLDEYRKSLDETL